jgi:sugar/nucleoside kinase (ribokinase family)
MDLFKNKKILIIGDVMLDSYLFGNVDRISPEAPVPIVDVVIKQDKLGGAANVATNIKNLGGTPLLCSIIGNDQKGEIFLSLLKKLKIKIDYILLSENRITTNKTRIIGNIPNWRYEVETLFQKFDNANLWLWPERVTNGHTLALGKCDPIASDETFQLLHQTDIRYNKRVDAAWNPILDANGQEQWDPVVPQAHVSM